MAVIKFHNTLSGEKEVFQPINENTIGIYSCGPTVYDRIHIGNIRSFIFADILNRVLMANGYETTLIRNITDIDDKTIKRSKAEGISLAELTLKYEAAYFDDLNKVNVLLPTQSPRATDHIPKMIEIIEDLLSKGLAYVASDGVYFSIKKSKGYGALAHIHIDTASQQERIANDEYDKESPQDFALWKFWSEEDGDNAWDTSFGKGRPGWHIECSAMSTEYLGATFDIHTGGIDLIFPHHTNEIAQSEGVNNAPLANYWLHNGHILVDGKKMAKSAKNYYTLEDIEAQHINPLAFRYWLLTGHYRTQVNFTLEALTGSQTAFKRLVSVLRAIEDNTGTIQQTYYEKFLGFVNDDLDTPQAVALMWDLLKDDSVKPADKKVTVLEFDKVFGLNLIETLFTKEKTIPEEVEQLVSERETARLNKDFITSDKLRGKINALGFDINDTESGPHLEPR